MLRDLIDAAVLEDFVEGLARNCGLRLAVFDTSGQRIAASSPRSTFARLTGLALLRLPRSMPSVALPADAPPATVAFVCDCGVWHVVAPVHSGETVAGYVAAGELRDPTAPPPARPPEAAVSSDAEWLSAWEALPPLGRSGEAWPVQTARWAARMLSYWCRRESQLDAIGAELALVGDIGALLSGQHDLQTILDHIVAETARVMKCPYASLRLYDPQTDELQIAAAYNLSYGYRHIPRIRRRDNPIDAEALLGRTVYIENAQTDPRFQFREEARRMGLVSGLTAGMIYRGRPVGVLRIYSNRKQRFRASQRHLLRAVASQAAIAIANAQLLEERLRSAAVERQLAMAGQVQSRLMRVTPPAHPRLRTAVVFEPSSHVGGDFCDVLPLPDGYLLAAIGDVTGHGLPAALLTASVRGALRTAVQFETDPGRLLEHLNAHACRETGADEFVSLLVAVADPAGRRLRYASAGHEPPLLTRAGDVLVLEGGGLVLGLEESEPYETHTAELRCGDFLLLFTDGVIEAMDFSGAMFGRERLRAALLQYGALPADQALRNIRWDVRRFVGLAEQSDDLTMVAVQVIA